MSTDEKQVAVITGSAMGIGAETARAFLERIQSVTV